MFAEGYPRGNRDNSWPYFMRDKQVSIDTPGSFFICNPSQDFRLPIKLAQNVNKYPETRKDDGEFDAVCGVCGVRGV